MNRSNTSPRSISTDQLRRFRRWAIVLIFVFAAVITPSQDPYSLFFTLSGCVRPYFFEPRHLKSAPSGSSSSCSTTTSPLAFTVTLKAAV